MVITQWQMLDEPESGERAPQRCRKDEPDNSLACSPAQNCELIQANILTEPTRRDTQQSHSRWGVKMKNGMRTHKRHVKESENVEKAWIKRQMSQKRWQENTRSREAWVHACSSDAEPRWAAHPLTQLDVQLCTHSPSSPGSYVVVLSAPAPVLVREAIHLHVLVWSHCRHPTKILWVRQPGRITSPTNHREIVISIL